MYNCKPNGEQNLRPKWHVFRKKDRRKVDMIPELKAQTFNDFCAACACNREAWSVYELLAGDLSGDVGNVAFEVIQSITNWPEVVEALKALDVEDQETEAMGTKYLAQYLNDEELIAWEWQDSENATFKEVVEKIIGDGEHFIEYLRRLKLERMTFKEFSMCHGCRNDDDPAATKFFDENHGIVSWIAGIIIANGDACDSIEKKLFKDPDNPTDEEVQNYYNQIIEYLRCMRFIGVWRDLNEDKTFKEALANEIGDGTEFVNFLDGCYDDD